MIPNEKYETITMKKENIRLKKRILIFAPFTLGLSFIGYNSQKQALLNKETNKNNKEWNGNHKIKIDQENSLLLKEIQQFNERCNNTIGFN